MFGRWRHYDVNGAVPLLIGKLCAIDFFFQFLPSNLIFVKWRMENNINISNKGNLFHVHWNMNNIGSRAKFTSTPSGSLRKPAYSNILKIFPPKNEKFQIKISDIFYISAQNIVCGYSLEPPRRGGSNEFPQSMFLCRNKKNNIYPCKPQFYYMKVGFKGVKTI